MVNFIYRTSFCGVVPYIEDPYDRKRELTKKELEEHYAKMQDKAFSQKVKGRETFATIKEAFGEDRDYPNRKAPAKREPLMEHDFPFKPSNPSKKGYNKTLGKFPDHMPEPIKQVMRKTSVGDEKSSWRTTYKFKSKPTPSVVTSFRNLKIEFPSVYRRGIC